MEHPVLLTGGASGVGEATAELLLKRGRKVISIDVKPFTTSSFEHHHCDLSDPASCLLYTSPSPRDQRGSGIAASG